MERASREPRLDGRTAVVILFPRFDPIVDHLRRRHDPTAREGMGAHVTVVTPFVPFDSLVPEDLRRLVGLFASSQIGTLTFNQVATFPGVSYLAPTPATAISELIARVEREWPSYPSYGGKYGTPTPHLTIAHADPDHLGSTLSEI